jgi:hypothetical protein
VRVIATLCVIIFIGGGISVFGRVRVMRWQVGWRLFVFVVRVSVCFRVRLSGVRFIFTLGFDVGFVVFIIIACGSFRSFVIRIVGFSIFVIDLFLFLIVSFFRFAASAILF